MDELHKEPRLKGKKVVVLLSGGLDSSTLLGHVIFGDAQAYALSFNYGQRHRRELAAAADVADYYGLIVSNRYKLADLQGVGRQLLFGSSQTSPEVPVPHGHYTDETMKKTVVPNRNMIMMSVAAGWAIALKADLIAYAAHAGDHAIYPDCRPEFIESVAQTIFLADWHKVQLFAPFQSLSKGEIARRAKLLRVPIASTYSCYEGDKLHCGQCGTCVERIEAFRDAGITDPTPYKSRAF